MQTENAAIVSKQPSGFLQTEHTQIKKHNMPNTPEAFPVLPSRPCPLNSQDKHYLTSNSID